MPDALLNKPSDIIRLDRVPGQNIIFKNFRGRPMQFNKEGDRNFCLIIPGSLLRDQLAARGCNIKKLSDGTEFVNVAVRITPAEDATHIWTALDLDHIDQADLTLDFVNYEINGKRFTKIYLKDARFYVKAFNIGYNEIVIHRPDIVIYSTNKSNTNNTEETKMEKIMSVEEVFTQFALMEYAFKNANVTEKKSLEDIMKAIRAAKYYLYKTSCDTEQKTKKESVTKPTVTGYELEKAGDFASIKQVIFNDPATIVVWFDDVKTVVKCQEGDTFDKEKGLAMAICKRLYGNESNFNNLIKKWTEPKTKKAERMAQAEANKTAKGKSKVDKKKALDKARNGLKNTNGMVILSDAYVRKLRVKMAERGMNYVQLAEKAGLGKSTVSRLISTKKLKYVPARIRRSVFDKLNAALGIRWKE